jgi:hypothetical protein
MMKGMRRNPLLIGAITAGTLIYLYLDLFVLTDLEGSVSLWILLLAGLVTVIVRRKRGAAAKIWYFAALLVIATTEAVQDFALRLRWSISQFNTFLTVKHWVLLGMVGCLAVTAVVTLIRQASSADRTAADHP